MTTVEITRKPKGMPEVLAEDDYRKKHEQITIDEVRAVWGEDEERVNHTAVKIGIPENIRNDLKAEMVGKKNKARLPVFIDGKWGDVEIVKRSNGCMLWIWYEDSPENWTEQEHEKTAAEGDYNLDTDECYFIC